MEPGQLLVPRRGRIVVGTDGSAASLTGVRWALEAARQTGAWLDVVLVWCPDIDFGWLGAEPLHGWRAEPAAEGHALVAAAVNEACGRPHPEIVRTFVIEGDPACCLLAHARGADVLVLGARGAGGFLGLRLGSVASTCATHPTCPVVIVPTGGKTASPVGTQFPLTHSAPPRRTHVRTGAFR
jgi:nucleotide-binding universal stress UspA family protein